MSLSGKPYICETSLSGLWVNTGHGHMGWTLCAGSAELINEMITKGKYDTRFQISK
jgi:D-amino-acid dehydrogenase